MKYIILLLLFCACSDVSNKPDICSCPLHSAAAAEAAIVESYLDAYEDSIAHVRYLDSLWEHDPPMNPAEDFLKKKDVILN